MTARLWVLVPTPAHSTLADTLSYQSATPWPVGTLVRVPLGARELLGIVWDAPASAGAQQIAQDVQLRPVSAALDAITALSSAWRDLVCFTARYYQRSVGEVALSALPAPLRDMSATQLARRLQRYAKARTQTLAGNGDAIDFVALSAEQTAVLSQFDSAAGPFLLFGSTGSGKTEVYLRCVQQLLERDPTAQALVMVPEINLTPQLESRFRARFCHAYGSAAVCTLHSGMTPAQRLQSWLAAHLGHARILLGTRMAVFASLPRLGLIVVDEEHDPSYRSQDGARYSARDLALYRARTENVKILLGSATPSLESWHHSRSAAQGGRYVRLAMPTRIGTGAALPLVRCVDMGRQARHCVIAPPLLEAIAQRVARGEQSLLLLNQRGYAVVLHCADCGWKSACPHCSAYRVFHKADRSLRCHHCSLGEPVPRACPQCGNPDIAALGRGTERLEEHLAQLLIDVRRADTVSPDWPQGAPVRIARIDADSTRLRGALQAQLASVHAGEVDVLVGTQMIAKGHDFRKVTLVAAVNPDSALFSSDFRAAERLFSLLMQAGGRAGRSADLSRDAEMWVQTFHPQHPLFGALRQHDYPAFAAQQLREREQATLPPFGFQALTRSEARSQERAQDFLNAARTTLLAPADAASAWPDISIYPAVPMGLQRVAQVERAQMLIESASRSALQRFLPVWQEVLRNTRKGPQGKGLLRWAVDVDPLSI